MSEKDIDQKRPVHAAAEPRKEQQRLVDETVDESFPASDPPAWTTTGTKSVAAQYDEHGKPIAQDGDAEGSGLAGVASQFTERAAGLAQDVYERGQRYVEEGRRRYPQVEGYARAASSAAYDMYERAQEYLQEGNRRYPEVRRYSRAGVRAVRQPVQEYPIAALLAAAAAGYFLATVMHSRSDERSSRSWSRGDRRWDYSGDSPKPHGDEFSRAVPRRG
jgi:hypothetical protein